MAGFSVCEVFPLLFWPWTHPQWNTCLDRGWIVFQPLRPSAWELREYQAQHSTSGVSGGGGWPFCMERGHGRRAELSRLDQTAGPFVYDRKTNESASAKHTSLRHEKRQEKNLKDWSLSKPVQQKWSQMEVLSSGKQRSKKKTKHLLEDCVSDWDHLKGWSCSCLGLLTGCFTIDECNSTRLSSFRFFSGGGELPPFPRTVSRIVTGHCVRATWPNVALNRPIIWLQFH